MLLDEEPRSDKPVNVFEPHFKNFSEFRTASYAKRYELLCHKLVRERLYDSACFLTSDRSSGLYGGFKEPSSELSFHNFIVSLIGKVAASIKFESPSGDDD